MSRRRLEMAGVLGTIIATTLATFEPAGYGDYQRPRKDEKPKFSDEELAQMRALPKRERQRFAAQLKQKYAKGAG